MIQLQGFKTGTGKPYEPYTFRAVKDGKVIAERKTMIDYSSALVFELDPDSNKFYIIFNYRSTDKDSAYGQVLRFAKV